MIQMINHSFMLYHGTFIVLNYLHLWIYFRHRGMKFNSPFAEATIGSLLSLYTHTYTCQGGPPPNNLTTSKSTVVTYTFNDGK